MFQIESCSLCKKNFKEALNEAFKKNHEFERQINNQANKKALIGLFCIMYFVNG